jgi:hypothetical protein
MPVSIQALSTVKLEQLNVASFNDYVKYLPSVSQAGTLRIITNQPDPSGKTFNFYILPPTATA